MWVFLVAALDATAVAQQQDDSDLAQSCAHDPLDGTSLGAVLAAAARDAQAAQPDTLLHILACVR